MIPSPCMKYLVRLTPQPLFVFQNGMISIPLKIDKTNKKMIIMLEIESTFINFLTPIEAKINDWNYQ